MTLLINILELSVAALLIVAVAFATDLLITKAVRWLKK